MSNITKIGKKYRLFSSNQCGYGLLVLFMKSKFYLHLYVPQLHVRFVKDSCWMNIFFLEKILDELNVYFDWVISSLRKWAGYLHPIIVIISGCWILLFKLFSSRINAFDQNQLRTNQVPAQSDGVCKGICSPTCSNCPWRKQGLWYHCRWRIQGLW